MAIGFFSVLTQSQIEDIHRAALRVLHETGVQVESQELPALLGEFGGAPDFGTERIRFAVAWVEQFIADSDKYDWSCHQPSFGCHAGVYQRLYFGSQTDELEQDLRAIIARANAAD